MASTRASAGASSGGTRSSARSALPELRCRGDPALLRSRGLAESAYRRPRTVRSSSLRLDDTDLVHSPEPCPPTPLIDFLVEDVTSIKALAQALMPPRGRTASRASCRRHRPSIRLAYCDRFAPPIVWAIVSMEEQVEHFARLKLDIDNRANEDEPRPAAHPPCRPDASGKVREDIDGPSRPPDVASGRGGDVGPGTPAARVDLPRSGWYADPTGRFEMRYWDGPRWTEHVDGAVSSSIHPAAQAGERVSGRSTARRPRPSRPAPGARPPSPRSRSAVSDEQLEQGQRADVAVERRHRCSQMANEWSAPWPAATAGPSDRATTVWPAPALLQGVEQPALVAPQVDDDERRPRVAQGELAAHRDVAAAEQVDTRAQRAELVANWLATPRSASPASTSTSRSRSASSGRRHRA